MKNSEIADLLDRTALLLEAVGENRFKIVAFRRAAKNVRNLSEDIEDVWNTGGLEQLPGIGKGIAKKIDEYIRTGKITYLQKLENQVPQAAIDLMAIPGIGPRTAFKLTKEHGIQNIDSLREAIQNGSLDDFFGPTIRKKIISEIEMIKSTSKRMLLPQAEEIAGSIVEYLKAGGIHIIIAGSIRRCKATVGDIDAIALDENAVELLSKFPHTSKVLSRGTKKASFILDNGVQVDVRISEKDELGATLLYFTGSKDHSIALRNIAISKGYKLNEYGLFDESSGKLIASGSEEGIYKALGMQYIEPELREDRGEIQAALQGRLPNLLRKGSLKGDLQMHTLWSDGLSTIEQMAREAKLLGYEYIAITDHSKSARLANGLNEDRFLRQWKEIDALNEKMSPFTILKGVEVEIKGDGSLDLEADFLNSFDVVGISMHQGYNQSPEKLTQRMIKAMGSKRVHYLCHPTNRLIGIRGGHEINMERIIQEAKDRGIMIEINSQPNRLDIDEVWARKAAEEGVDLVINSDAHSTEELTYVRYGENVARRAWLESKNVINTLSLNQLLRRLS
ncbi:MAG: DNA polymerase/3'-5' exonuclease PolX [Nitrososphaerota archaeon]